MSNHLVTFGEYSALARRRGWTVQFLTEQFRGKIENPSDFFSRALDPRNAGCVVPYRSVLRFYLKNVEPAAGSGVAEPRSCMCGCGRPVSGRKKLATGYCRVKMARQRAHSFRPSGQVGKIGRAHV